MECGTASSSTGDSSVTLSHREQEMAPGWEQPFPGSPGAAGLIPQVPDSHPVSFDAHVTFEARETIFTLKMERGKITQGAEMGKK